MVQNKSFIFKNPPVGVPKVGLDLTIEDLGFDQDAAPPAGGITLKNYYASLDPYQRARMRDPKIKSYFPAFQLDQPIDNNVVAKVLKSDNEKFKPGDIVVGMIPIQEYSALSAQQAQSVRLIQNSHNLHASNFLGPLGMPGLTAFSSFYEIGQPKKGETIFISAASGAVGQIVGQLAKLEGLTVIGSVGDDKKLDFITNELKFDAGFNYKKEKPSDALTRLAPQGIDIYYENVGGETLEAAINAMNNRGRIIACGMISQYNLQPHERYGVSNLFHIVSKRITMRGFIVSDPEMGPKYAVDHQKKLQQWIADGSFKVKLHVDVGIDAAPDAFLGMLSGKNFGKAVLQIADIDKE
ncbi:putative nadp-dependent leukotriene b4 12-hydroxydehydrogenase protein [Lasiodiplodia theobromae]|uniref:NADP-dependent oxidoreductase RED1 n=1 Tax=Lasiodiplodia theobromae TaxID=45133 RepID=A0A5N5DEC3_9PEZI|nr:NADP-dependent leukotriene b4 12-hydroxydehydrogenase [Lasiodiplodia theobromae]KAB2576206.1 NADP-dependent oxidoreductase RED1 [Lasiodiplodia theobromae]KAF4545639.1 NADP-dependent leukotriene b4 12-hydroxydehydrogenase [Lasiodiplodia theobromae]KAF9636192.1 putative nadp-dependent leukotriene b4 12-hydroxydehydrogenase protein [Lasiodiplodia theobromae]